MRKIFARLNESAQPIGEPRLGPTEQGRPPQSTVFCPAGSLRFWHDACAEKRQPVYNANGDTKIIINTM